MEGKRSSTTFAVTFNLLSQYIKNNNNPSPPAAAVSAGKTPTTMPLLPGAVDLDNEESLRKTREIQLFPQRSGFEEPKVLPEEKSKLTIFYGGKVLVFDSFPAEKARDIMQLASKAQNNGVEPQQTSPATNAAAKQSPRPAEVTEIPLARNNSLRRFLQKRKDRINSRAPYQVTIKKENEEEKGSSSSSWLALGPQISSFQS